MFAIATFGRRPARSHATNPAFAAVAGPAPNLGRIPAYTQTQIIP